MEDLISSVGSVAVGALSSAGSGGILGLVGSMVGGFFRTRQAVAERKMRQLEFDQELKLQELQIRVGQAETEREIDLANAAGSWTGLEQSLRSDQALNEHISPWVANVKSLFRPVLTMLLCALTGALLWALLAGQVEPDSLFLDHAAVAELVDYTVRSVVFTTSTAVAWWFGDRSFAAPNRK